MKTNHFCLSLTLLILGVSSSVAQDTLLIKPAKIDSLQQLIDSRPKADEEKVRLLNEYARLCFYNEEYLNGFNATIEARELSKKLKFAGGEVMYHYTLAVFFAYGGMFSYYIQKARISSAQLKNREFFEEAVMPSGYRPTATKERIEKLKPVYEHFKELGEKEVQAIMMNQFAFWYYGEGNISETKRTLEEIIELYLELNETYPVILHFGSLSGFADSEQDKEKIEYYKNEIAERLKRITDKNEIGTLNHQLANFYRSSGQNQMAIKHYLSSVKYLKSINDEQMLADVYGQMETLYTNLEMYIQSAEVVEKQIELLKELERDTELRQILEGAVWVMLRAKRYNDARKYVNILLKDTSRSDYNLRIAQQHSLEGEIALELGDYKEAIPELTKALEIYVQNNFRWAEPWVASHLAYCYFYLGEYKTALDYALSSMDFSKAVNSDTRYEKRINFITSKIYDALGNELLAYQYLKKYQQLITDEETNQTNQVVETLISSVLEQSQEEIEQLEQERALKEQQNKNQRLWIFSITGALLSALILALILYRNNKNKQKANKLLREQKEEIQTTLEQLEATQSQLIQSEKMASLGELTAGIAHEIQNPLNFVNNFSEVNKELLLELKEEFENGNMDEVIAIADDVIGNEEKINHHGKRAESIVKGMLLHSRGSSGQKEPTDLNALCDEYLRLSYHGFRARDKSFNADFKLEADESLPKINIIPQDIGRVLLNLINNAFYAVGTEKTATGEKPKSAETRHALSLQTLQKQKDYKPMVIVSTGNMGNHVEIRIKDNGPGIPDSLKDKIFQPFFTTKPTGHGTGLGLSLSYDIVKAHRGTITVESLENSGTEFIIILPATEIK